ncbi:MAG: epoxyqueuosine reductase QueH [Clostridiales Family XIII bacterium]|jgi:predicted adenine nucleotide alpha hydrolase (AANH) superfamily ATPase|nr:epoxyqueuosine reductase QueH [Clostridiales Family XIII bacterium]
MNYENVIELNIDERMDLSSERELSAPRKSILVHSCCGPCSTSVCERLAPDYDVTLFFYNPNITDREEYMRRLEAQRIFVAGYNMRPETDYPVTLAIGSYEPQAFYEAARGYEDEPEGGARCIKCFKLRIGEAAAYASLHGFNVFTTTLSVSPHKDFTEISKIGGTAAIRGGLTFLAEDFKKKDGYRRSVEMSKAYGLYRQQYCGCEFSKGTALTAPQSRSDGQTK